MNLYLVWTPPLPGLTEPSPLAVAFTREAAEREAERDARSLGPTIGKGQRHEYLITEIPLVGQPAGPPEDPETPPEDPLRAIQRAAAALKAAITANPEHGLENWTYEEIALFVAAALLGERPPPPQR